MAGASLVSLLGGVGTGLAGGIGYGFGLRYGFERMFPAFAKHNDLRAVGEVTYNDIYRLMHGESPPSQKYKEYTESIGTGDGGQVVQVPGGSFEKFIPAEEAGGDTGGAVVPISETGPISEESQERVVDFRFRHYRGYPYGDGAKQYSSKTFAGNYQDAMEIHRKYYSTLDEASMGAGRFGGMADKNRKTWVTASLNSWANFMSKWHQKTGKWLPPLL